METHNKIIYKTLSMMMLVALLCMQASLANKEDQLDQENQQPTFDVWEYRIEGNTLLDNTEIEKAVYAFLGPNKTLTEVEQARTSLEGRYRSQGYGTILVDIPEQRVEDTGIVRLKVIEATVERVKVTGSRYFSNRWIKKQVPSLEEGQVPNLQDTQEELALLNTRSRDRSITPIIRPGKSPGKVEMELKVKDAFPLHYSTEINDRNSADTTDLRLNASLNYDNLWQKEHSASLNFQTSPKDTDDVEVWSFNYLYRPERSNNLYLFYAVDSDSDVASVGDIGVIGNGTIYGTRAIYPLGGTSSYVHNFTAGFDYKDFEDNITIGDFAGDAIVQEIDYGLTTLAYGGTIIGDEQLTRFNIAANFGIRGLFNTENEFNNKRFGADPNFYKLLADVERGFSLPKGFNVNWRAAAQFAPEPLISNEQYSLGGADSVRGYLESDVLVDQGINSSLELQTPYIFENSFENQWFSSLQFFSFIDWATGELREALPEQEDTFDLLGTGLGVRVSILDYINASIAWGRPLKETNATDKNDDRMHFSVKYNR